MSRHEDKTRCAGKGYISLLTDSLGSVVFEVRTTHRRFEKFVECAAIVAIITAAKVYPIPFQCGGSSANFQYVLKYWRRTNLIGVPP